MKRKQNPKIYLNLEENFFKIKHILSFQPVNANKLDAVLGDLRFSRNQIEKNPNSSAIHTEEFLFYSVKFFFVFSALCALSILLQLINP